MIPIGIDPNEEEEEEEDLSFADAPGVNCQSLYPDIEDYDALLLLQLRYLFCEHEFLNLPWKSMQAAGWTYVMGRYISPGKTRVFDNSNDLTVLLDRPAVPNTNDTMIGKRDHIDLNTEEKEEEEERKESVVQLRNNIVYNMQKIIERAGRNSKDGSFKRHQQSHECCKEDTELQSQTVNNRGSSSSNTSTTGEPRQKTHDSAKKEISKSVTATDRGTDLYLHRKTRAKKKINQAPLSFNSTETLNFPTLTECSDRMATYDTSECERIEKYYQQNNFAQWRHLLSTNHSLLFYGNGSKHRLLSDFAIHELKKEGYVLQIDGFHPDVTIHGILDLLVSLFLDNIEPDSCELQSDLFLQQSTQMLPMGVVPESHNLDSPSVVGRAILIARALARHHSCSNIRTPQYPIFLVIHNIDGVALRNDQAQRSIAAIIQHSIVDRQENHAILRLVASIDHVDACTALWSSLQGFQFQWIWNEVHTHRPYVQELVVLQSEVQVFQEKKKQSLSTKTKSISYHRNNDAVAVLRNLAPRYSEVIQILARLQLQQIQAQSQQQQSISSTSRWVEFKIFLMECKNNFVIDKESNLRSLQTELKDHQLIESRMEGNVDYVSIPHDVPTIREIVKYKRESEK